MNLTHEALRDKLLKTGRLTELEWLLFRVHVDDPEQADMLRRALEAQQAAAPASD